MNREKTMQYVELDAERMIRKGAIRRTLRPARLWTTAFILSIVVPLGGLAVFLRLSVKSNNSLFIGIAEFWFFAFLIPLYFIGNPLRSAKESYRDAVLQSYGALALGTRFTDLQIRQGSGVSWGTVAGTEMIFPGGSLDSVSILRGQYRGIPFEQSEVQTIATVRKLYKSGPRYEDKTFFRGQWTVVPLNGRYQPVLQIIERGFRNKRNRLSLLARYTVGHRYFPKSPGFNFRFRVYAPDREDADYILTPETLKQIRDMAAQTRGRLMLCFVNGALHIVVQRRRGAFSPPSVFLPFREERAIALIQREIAPFTRLIDALNPDGKLFRHEEIQLPAKPAEKILWLD